MRFGYTENRCPKAVRRPACWHTPAIAPSAIRPFGASGAPNLDRVNISYRCLLFSLDRKLIFKH